MSKAGRAVRSEGFQDRCRQLMVVIAGHDRDPRTLRGIAKLAKERLRLREDTGDRRLAELQDVAQQHHVVGALHTLRQCGARARVPQQVAPGEGAQVQVGDDDRSHVEILAIPWRPVASLFCRHNRFTADCPICSKGTVLDAGRTTGRRARPRAAAHPAGGRGKAPAQFSGPHVSAGPYQREHGGSYEVRLERVPGGVRLAQWSGGRLERRAPELPVADLLTLLAAVAERDLLPSRDSEALADVLRLEPAPGGADGAASPGRAGDLREELRVERRDGDRVRIARWLLYPSRGWELQDAPPMLPAARYAEAFRSFFAG